MKSVFLHILILITLGLLASSCTTGRWVVDDPSAVDQNKNTVLEEKLFLKQTGTITSENPILRMELLSRTTYEYPEKVLAHRKVQDYKLRPGFVALGLTGAALAFYAANADALKSHQTPANTFVLNTAGVILGLSGFLNMKPVGEPRTTGEERFLRTTGTHAEVDTVQAADNLEKFADVRILYGDELVSENNLQPIESGLLEVELGSALSSLNIQGTDTEEVEVQILFSDSTYTESYSLDQILQPYARVSSPITELRSSADEDGDNVLAELVNGSQVPILEEEGSWYRVQYGISENYVLKEDTDLFWRSSEFAQLNSVFAVAQVPFGNIDVENNIPILTGANEKGVSLVISNEDYGGLVTPRTYAHRDGKLVRTYLENALGYQEDKIFSLEDVSTVSQLSQQIRTLEQNATDSSTLFIYLNGYSSVSQQDDGYQFNFLLSPDNGSSGWEHAADLNELFEQISGIPARKKIVVADLNFEISNDTLPDFETQGGEPLRELAEIITANDSNTAVLFGSRLSQEAELYVNRSGDDKKHHIFTYYFAKAIQERNTSMASINQFLQRNVTFISRKIHDQPQDPQFFGNIELLLIPDE